MKIFKGKGELTRFQILAEIARSQPHLRQRDIAKKIGITVQAVSENIKSLVKEGYVEYGHRRSEYRLTKKGLEKLRKYAMSMKEYINDILDVMRKYKTIWPAIAKGKIKKGDYVELFLENGVLYAKKIDSPANAAGAYAKAITNANDGEDVAVMDIKGTINVPKGEVTILVLPTMFEGGSKACDFEKIKKIIEEKSFDRVGIMGTIARAVANKLGIKYDFEFAAPECAIHAANRGLSSLILAVGRMSERVLEKLEKENIPYTVEDVRKSR